MAAVVFLFNGVAGVLALVVDGVLFDVGLEDVVGGHAEGLGEGDEEVEEVDDFDFGVLVVEGLVFGPPFPGDAINELGDFLGHGAGVVEDPLGFLFFGEVAKVDADPLVELFLEAEDFFEFIGLSHAGM